MGLVANTYLSSLRHRVRIHRPTSTSRRRGEKLFISFARTLDQSTSESDADDDVDWIFGSYVSHARADGHDSIETTVLKRRRLSSFSDLQGPPKYSRSTESQSTYNASTKFDITHNREPLTYFVASSPARKLEPESHPKTLTQRDLDKLIKDLDAVIPGIRLSERLKNVKDASQQAITDFLSEHVISSLLRIHLTLFDRTPNTFLSLTELSFSGTRVHDFDLIHIHHLPKLSILFLNNTGIGNEAVYLLIPLKRTLTQLTLATNPDIDSTSVPAILLLSKLCYLSIADTSIDMNGLRTLAKRVDEEGEEVGFDGIQYEPLFPIHVDRPSSFRQDSFPSHSHHPTLTSQKRVYCPVPKGTEGQSLHDQLPRTGWAKEEIAAIAGGVYAYKKREEHNE
ncbi:uncharacterized protein LACBIDRAFT_331008 [Laccaria bicolor S238N-H82]|uniref:Predicted protein n=1 Tax=Laccaria bicolor (strain S238N-H82 / ATCC MYA-4686) TaxID=486041 RepID=B0DMY8_LACBS|nr:uncharacterized protein LACBIDRAFT_331008 [Laccaria bicolor S238N-H82]EDR04131.1 predicted protein [Laccaria bicolor S238N-H82]|eukprot:XP_001885386.1 predicted protein [Laccaria bicolor S238N-H82]